MSNSDSIFIDQEQTDVAITVPPTCGCRVGVVLRRTYIQLKGGERNATIEALVIGCRHCGRRVSVDKSGNVYTHSEHEVVGS